MNKILITGVSSGIGEALADLYLAKDYAVYGIARRTPYRLARHPNFRFRSCDLSRPDEIHALFDGDFASLIDGGIDTLFLNAGVSGDVPARGEDFSSADLEHVLAVNVHANKVILDRVLASPNRPATCVVSASMAGVRFRAGTLPYSVSKAALAALAGVYAEENPGIFFAVLGLCNVNTGLSRQVSFSERTAQFPDLKALQGRALSDGYMVSPAQRAHDIFDVINAPGAYGLQSGKFADIRQLLAQPRAQAGLAVG
jgi:benzil reductase ((S)-benzoin forming)